MVSVSPQNFAILRKNQMHVSSFCIHQHLTRNGNFCPQICLSLQQVSNYWWFWRSFCTARIHWVWLQTSKYLMLTHFRLQRWTFLILGAATLEIEDLSPLESTSFRSWDASSGLRKYRTGLKMSMGTQKNYFFKKYDFQERKSKKKFFSKSDPISSM